GALQHTRPGRRGIHRRVPARLLAPDRAPGPGMIPPSPWRIAMIRAATVWTCLVLFAIPARLAAQKDKDKPAPGDEMIYKYLCAEADKLSKKVLDGARALEEWQKKRPRLHQEYMDMLGLSPLPEKTPLKAKITGSFTHEGVAIENLHFQSMP